SSLSITIAHDADRAAAAVTFANGSCINKSAELTRLRRRSARLLFDIVDERLPHIGKLALLFGCRGRNGVVENVHVRQHNLLAGPALHVVDRGISKGQQYVDLILSRAVQCRANGVVPLTGFGERPDTIVGRRGSGSA